MTKSQPYVPQSLGARIAHARRLLGVREGADVTVPELAERVGVSAASVYNWENNAPMPTRQNVARLAKVLGVTVPYLESGVLEPEAFQPGKGRRAVPNPDAIDRGKAEGE